jgi:tripartite-type tricarboxylate transporter receptor subunit TctC
MIRRMKKRALPFAAVALAMLLSVPSQAQQPWPNKPIRLVLPFAAGSATDIAFRVISDQTRESLGQPIILDPKPGAGAVLATEAVMGAAPDGYTLMVSTSSQTVSTARPNPPFDVRKMTHVVMAQGGPLFISVNAKNMTATTLKEFIDYAKANPGKVNFGSYGAGSLSHLGIELFNRLAGINTTHIPFSGSATESMALAQGTTDASMGLLIFTEGNAKAGKVRVLAATSVERSPVAPEYPAMRELGVPGMDIFFWQGIAGPPGMPRDVVVRLNSAFNTALRSQPVVEHMKKVRNLVYGGTPEAITELVNREVDTWAKLIREANIKFE